MSSNDWRDRTLTWAAAGAQGRHDRAVGDATAAWRGPDRARVRALAAAVDDAAWLAGRLAEDGSWSALAHALRTHRLAWHLRRRARAARTQRPWLPHPESGPAEPRASAEADVLTLALVPTATRAGVGTTTWT